MENRLWESYIHLIKKEVIPALGCTEPVAVALASARAKEILGDNPESIEVSVSRNILKNAMGVGIPGTGMIGLEIAAALGAIGGESKLELEVLKKITEQDIRLAKEMVRAGKVHVSYKDATDVLYINITMIKGENRSRVIIKGSHKNIVFEALNDELIIQKDDTVEDNKSAEAEECNIPLSMRDIFDFAERAPIGDLNFILESAKLNSIISDEGLKNCYGMKLGKTIEKNIDRGIYSHDIATEAVKRTAAAIDARMSGSMLAVMSNSGSGNQGITATVPVLAVAEMLDAKRDKLIRALILSHLTAIHVKSGLSKLSPLCGAIVAATGASCGITYLLGGDYESIEYAIFNMVGNVAGMICDGAKNSCSLKVGATVSAAVHAAILAIDGEGVSEEQGIVDRDVEKTIRNLGIIGTDGMADTDKVILDIMVSKNRADCI